MSHGSELVPVGYSLASWKSGAAADLGFKAHAHMLRHACGYKLANDGHDTRALQHYLGHRNIQHTHPVHRIERDPLHEFLALTFPQGRRGIGEATSDPRDYPSPPSRPESG